MTDCFVEAGPGDPLRWTCVRTRPRWEKRFATWLLRKGYVHFLPTVERETTSGRHRRVSQVVLFPGYVFVEGEWRKQDFALEGSVVRVIRPEGPQQIRQLHEELWNVWRGMRSGAYLNPVMDLARGEWCEISKGPLRGVRGRYEKPGHQGRVVLQVEMLGVGVAVEVPVAILAPVD